jgi:hypothetical protein
MVLRTASTFCLFPFYSVLFCSISFHSIQWETDPKGPFSGKTGPLRSPVGSFSFQWGNWPEKGPFSGKTGPQGPFNGKTGPKGSVVF